MPAGPYSWHDAGARLLEQQGRTRLAHDAVLRAKLELAEANELLELRSLGLKSAMKRPARPSEGPPQPHKPSTMATTPAFAMRTLNPPPVARRSPPHARPARSQPAAPLAEGLPRKAVPEPAAHVGGIDMMKLARLFEVTLPTGPKFTPLPRPPPRPTQPHVKQHAAARVPGKGRAGAASRAAKIDGPRLSPTIIFGAVSRVAPFTKLASPPTKARPRSVQSGRASPLAAG